MIQVTTVIFLVTFFAFSSAVVNVLVPSCAQDSIGWKVTGGNLGGVTYVETSTSAACSYNVTNSTSEDFTTNYSDCGATPVFSNSNTDMSLFIIVQANFLYNLESDVRVLVSCSFSTGTSSVTSIFVGQPLNPNGTPGKNVTVNVNPQPLLALYTTINGTETRINPSTLLVQGTKVTARITLDRNTTDYNMKVESGELSIGLPGSIAIKGSFQLLDGTTSCSLHGFFLSFEYLTTPGGYSYAETTFNVTIPTITDINLQTTNPELKLSFRVTLCLKNSGCVQVACADRSTSRRKRQIEGDAAGTGANGATNDSASYDLSDGFMVALEPGSDSLIDPVVEMGTNTENTVCLEKAEFWGLIMGLLGFLVLACLASCCLCFFLMRCLRRRRKERKTVVIHETSDLTTASSLSSGRALTGEPLNKGSFILPRFVAIPGYGNPQ